MKPDEERTRPGPAASRKEANRSISHLKERAGGTATMSGPSNPANRKGTGRAHLEERAGGLRLSATFISSHGTRRGGSAPPAPPRGAAFGGFECLGAILLPYGGRTAGGSAPLWLKHVAVPASIRRVLRRTRRYFVRLDAPSRSPSGLDDRVHHDWMEERHHLVHERAAHARDRQS